MDAIAEAMAERSFGDLISLNGRALALSRRSAIADTRSLLVAALAVLTMTLGATARNICVLRDAITAANSKKATNGCVAGTGTDTINFSVAGTIALATELPAIVGNLTIIGPSFSRVVPGITIDGNHLQIVAVDSSAQLTLRLLTLFNSAPAIGNSGTLTVTHMTFTANAAGAGGAITNSGKLTVSDSSFTNNFATASLFNVSGEGGAILNTKTAIISTSTFKGNESRGLCTTKPPIFCSGGKGGAIFNSGTLAVARSTFSGNATISVSGLPSSSRDGGAIYNAGGLSVTNSTFSGNSTGVNGGAIYTSSLVLITNSTFSGNSAANGAAVFGASSIKGSILAASTGGNCGTPPTDVGYNISDDTTCKFTKAGSANNLDPRLAGVANNGGPTQTIALQASSPAIDAIPLADCTDQSSLPKQLTTDQRGFPRPDAVEAVCDIGAYEFQE